jgi:hypothetical protein
MRAWQIPLPNWIKRYPWSVVEKDPAIPSVLPAEKILFV